MKRLLLVIILTTTLSAYGNGTNVDSNFVNDFKKATNKNFTEEQLNKMLKDYPGLMMPSSNVTRLGEQIAGHEMKLYPLYDFKNDTLYKDNIDNLLNSQNPNQRRLGYMVVASSYDTAREGILLNKLKTETNSGCLVWDGISLLYLRANHTTELFDFLVKKEDIGDALMFPMYVTLNKDSVQQTAYKRMNSNNIKAKILAAQSLSVMPLTPKTEELLKQAVSNWNIKIKGYAIYSIGELQIGDLLETFKPLLDSSQTRSIALKALANSPTKADQDYLVKLVNKQDTVDEKLLDCFYDSKHIENVKYWLKLLYTKPVPRNYVFLTFKHPLIFSDSILPELQTSLQKVKAPYILKELITALKNRKDDKSVDILISMLNNEDESVRYEAASTAKDIDSPRLKEQSTKDRIDRIIKEAK